MKTQAEKEHRDFALSNRRHFYTAEEVLAVIITLSARRVS